MKIKLAYATKEEIPEGMVELYVERDGQWQFDGIEDLRTQSDLDSLKGALRNEREAHRATKAELNKDLIDAKKKADDLEKQINEKEKDPGTKTPATGGDPNDPNYLALKADLEKQRLELEAIKQEKQALADQARQSKILDGIRKQAQGKIKNEAISDLELHAGNFDLTEEGKIVQKETGTSLDDWFSETLKSKPHWIPENVSGGAKGGDGNPASNGTGSDNQKKLDEFLAKDNLTLKESAEATLLAETIKAETKASKDTE